jgi:hypothetical protein
MRLISWHEKETLATEIHHTWALSLRYILVHHMSPVPPGICRMCGRGRALFWDGVGNCWRNGNEHGGHGKWGSLIGTDGAAGE